MKTVILFVGILINCISYTARADDIAGRYQIVPATIELHIKDGATIMQTDFQNRYCYRYNLVLLICA